MSCVMFCVFLHSISSRRRVVPSIPECVSGYMAVVVRASTDWKLGFPKIGLPLNHPFIDGSIQELNHPAIGVYPHSRSEGPTKNTSTARHSCVQKKGFVVKGYEPNLSYHWAFSIAMDGNVRSHSLPVGDRNLNVVNPFHSEKVQADCLLEATRLKGLPVQDDGMGTQGPPVTGRVVQSEVEAANWERVRWLFGG